MSDGDTERVRRVYERMAPRYDRMIGFWERRLFAGGREWACGQAKGDVLEIGIGTGRNLPFYPADVQLTGVELSPSMLEVARHRAKRLERKVDLRLGDVQTLEFPDSSFDTVLSTLTMCAIPDPRRAVAEAARVLRTGGALILFEHVRSPNAVVRAGQRMLEPLSRRLEADHLTREPLQYVLDQGFEVETLERSKWGIVERLNARKPVAKREA